MEKEPQPNYYDEYEIDLREYILLLWENKLFIGGLVVLAILIAFIFSSFLIEPTYETKARVQLSNYEGLYSKSDTAVQLLNSTNLMQRVMKKENLKISDAKLSSYINNNLSVKQINDTSIISLTVKNNEPELTYNILVGLITEFENDSNEYFEAKIKRDKEYISVLKDELKDINSNLVNNKNLIKESRNKGEREIASLLIQENSSLRNSKREIMKEIEVRESKLENFYPLKVLNEPYVPENKISHNINLNIAIAAVLAFMLAVFIVFFREFMREDQN